MLLTLLTACLVQTAPAVQDGDKAQEDVRPPRVVKVVDKATGQPIEGAVVHGVDEFLAPTWGRFWFTHRAVTGEAGEARFPFSTKDQHYGWVIVQAEGYAAVGDMPNGQPETTFELIPETPITIELRDFAGDLLPLAHLGVCVGCGHTPDVVSATTGPEGRATLRGIANVDSICDLYLVHPEVHMTYYDAVPFDQVKNGVATVYADPGSVVSGEVLLANGQPAAGYYVGNNIHHRGFWAKTDAQGRFRLHGAEARPKELQVKDPTGELAGWFSKSRTGAFRRLTLGRTEPEREGRLTVELFGYEDDQPLDGVVVEAWNPETGEAFRGTTQAEGTVTLRVPTGVFLVEVGGPETPYPAQVIGAVEFIGDEVEPVKRRVRLAPPRIVTLEAKGLKAGDKLYVQRADGTSEGWDIDETGGLSVKDWVVPSGRYGAHVWRQTGESSQERIQLRAEPSGGGALRLVPRP